MNLDILFPKYKEKFKSIIFLSPPTAKKSCIPHKLSCLGDFFPLSFREIFKQLDPCTPLGELCQKYTHNGFPLPDEVAMTLLERYINGSIDTYMYHPKKQVLILEEIPFNLHQAKLLDKSIEVICVISLIFKRLDCAEEEIKKRKMQLYKKETLKVLDHYPQANIISINAEQGLLDVFKDILTAIHNKI